MIHNHEPDVDVRVLAAQLVRVRVPSYFVALLEQHDVDVLAAVFRDGVGRAEASNARPDHGYALAPRCRHTVSI